MLVNLVEVGLEWTSTREWQYARKHIVMLVNLVESGLALKFTMGGYEIESTIHTLVNETHSHLGGGFL